MTLETILMAVAMAWFFWLAPKFSCSLTTAICLYLWIQTGTVSFGYIAGIFAIGTAIAGLNDLELKIEGDDKE